MRKITGKDYSKPPEILLRKGAKKKINNSIANGNGKLYNGHHYKDITVKNLLKSFSLGLSKLPNKADAKCYYCESTIEVGASLQVEHYRPKDGVNPIDNGNIEHPGYYHLGVEWSNLLLACAACNGPGAKGTRFPIKYSRAIIFNPILANNVLDRTKLKSNSSELIGEGPLLLNPELNNPDKHLTYSSKGKIKGLTKEGVTSVDIYKLNRILLVKARMDVLKEYISIFNMFIIAHKTTTGSDWNYFENLVIGLSENMIKDSYNLQCTYIQWRKFICSHFILTILPELDVNYRMRVYAVFSIIRSMK